MKMLSIILSVLVSVLATLAIVLATPSVVNFETPEYKQTPRVYKNIAVNATSTRSIAARVTHLFDSEYLEQGVCLRIKDSSGFGYTYLTVEDGAASWSAQSCE